MKPFIISWISWDNCNFYSWNIETEFESVIVFFQGESNFPFEDVDHGSHHIHIFFRGQQFAQAMQQQNPELVEQLRGQMGQPNSNPEDNPPGEEALNKIVFSRFSLQPFILNKSFFQPPQYFFSI